MRRLDLLPDEELDAYRSRFGSEALEASEVLAEALSVQLAQLEERARSTLELTTEARAILTVAVCLRCGTYEVVRMQRAWAIDRAMRRSGLPEREVHAALALLLDAGATGNLDTLDAERLRELHSLVGLDVDLESVRLRYGR